MDYLTDLESTCAALGTNDGAGSYHKDDDCLECVKDLIRFLRRDDGNNHWIEINSRIGGSMCTIDTPSSKSYIRVFFKLFERWE